MTKLHEKYTLLLEAIEHVLKLVSTMQALDEEINLYLEQKRCDDLENTGELEVGVK